MDAKRIIGSAIRAHREALRLSQEKLAERAEITYQYLSGLENGRENFTIGVLDALSKALGTNIPDLVVASYGHENPVAEYPRVNRNYLRDVPLPKGLSLTHVADALDETQRIIRLLNLSLVRSGGRALPSYIQANNFSGIVSNILTDSFDRLTPFKHNHDQRYPDLVSKDENGNTIDGLEVKSTIQIGKGGESHNGHSGWHTIACFKIDSDTGDIEFIHVMFASLVGHTLLDSDWKYVGSRVSSDTGSQRTETYNTTGVGTTKLRDGSAYLNPSEISFARWRPQHMSAIPTYSIFLEKGKALQG